MRATVMHAAGDVRIENVPDATLIEPTDALLRVTRACICGSDLWPYRSMQRTDHGQRMGHEAIGVVEAIGADVRTVKHRRKRFAFHMRMELFARSRSRKTMP
jgi:threonine dehydrogenase-like Zn-dependent dehydrogenase